MVRRRAKGTEQNSAYDIYENILKLNPAITPDQARRLVEQLGRGEFESEDQLYQFVQSVGRQPTGNQLADSLPPTPEAEMMEIVPDTTTTAAVIMDKFRAEPGQETVYRGGDERFPAYRRGRGSDFGTRAGNLGMSWLGGEQWRGDTKRPSVFFPHSNLPPLSNVKSQSSADASQAAAEFFLGGIWSYVDTSFFGIPGLLEWAGGKAGLWDEYGLGPFKSLEFVETPETLAGRVGHGIGGLLGFMAPTPIAPAKFLGAMKEKVARPVIHAAAKIPSKAKTVQKMVEAAKAAHPEKFAKLAAEIGDEAAAKVLGKGFEVATGTVKAAKGEHVIQGAFEQLGTMKYAEATKQIKTFNAIRQKAGGVNNYKALLEEGVTAGAKINKTFYNDIVENGVQLVELAAIKNGTPLSGEAAKVVSDLLFEGITKIHTVNNLSMKAASAGGAVFGHVAQHALELGTGMAAYQYLRHYVIDGIKEGINPWDSKHFSEGAQQVLGGFLSGAAMGMVTSAVPNIGDDMFIGSKAYRKMGGALATWKDAEAVNPTWQSKIARGWTRLLNPFRKKGLISFPKDKLDELTESVDGRERIFGIVDMVKTTINNPAGYKSAQALVENPLMRGMYSIFKKTNLRTKEDAQAAVKAIRALRSEVGGLLRTQALKHFRNDLIGAMPRMIATSVLLNAKSIFDKDQWKNNPGDLLFSLGTSAYIGYGGGWAADIYNSNFARNNETIWARGMIELLGAAQSNMPSTRGINGEKLGVWELVNRVDARTLHRGSGAESPWLIKSYDDSALNKIAERLNEAMIGAESATEQPEVDEHTILTTYAFLNAVQRLRVAHTKDKAMMPYLYEKEGALTFAQIDAVTKAIKRMQDNPQNDADLSWLVRKVNEVTEKDDESWVSATVDFAVDVNEKAGYGIEQGQVLLRPENPIDPGDMSPQAQQYRQLYRFYEESLIKVVQNSSHKISTEQRKSPSKKGGKVPDVDRPIKEVAIPNEDLFRYLQEIAVGTRSAYGRISNGRITELDHNAINIAGYALERMGYARREKVFTGEKDIVLPQDIYISGKQVNVINKENIIKLLGDAGLLHAVNGAMKFDETTQEVLGLTHDQETYDQLEAIVDAMVRLGGINRGTHKLTGVTDSQRTAMKTLVQALANARVNTTLYDNAQLQLAFLSKAGRSLTPRALAAMNYLVDRGRLNLETGDYYEPTFFGASTDPTVLEGDKDMSELVMSEQYGMYQDDIALLKKVGIIRKVNYLTGEGDVSSGRAMTPRAMVEELGEMYESAYVGQYAEHVANMVEEAALMAKKQGKLDAAVQRRLSMIYGIVAGGRSPRLLRALNILRQKGLFTSSLKEGIQINAKKFMEASLDTTLDELAGADITANRLNMSLDEYAEFHQRDMDTYMAQIDPIHNIRVRDVGGTIKRLGITAVDHLKMRDGVREGLIESPSKLRKMIIDMVQRRPDSSGKSPEDILKEHESIALYNSYAQSAEIDMIEYNTSNMPVTGGPTEQADATRYSETRIKTAHVRRSQLLHGTQEKYPGIRAAVVSDFGSNDKEYGMNRFYLYDMRNTSRGYDILSRIAAGTTRGNLRVTDRTHKQGIVEAPEEAGRPMLMVVDGGRVFGFRMPLASDVASRQGGIDFVRDMAKGLLRNVSPEILKADPELQSLSEIANGIVSAEDMLGTYENLINDHISKHIGEMVNGNPSKLQRLFTAHMLVEALGSDALAMYGEARRTAGTTGGAVEDFAKLINKRSKLFYSNDFSGSNIKLHSDVAGRLIDDGKIDTPGPKFVLAEDPNTREVDEKTGERIKGTGKKVRMVNVVFMDGMDTLDGAGIMQAALAHLWSATLGSEEISSVQKGGIFYRANGTNRSALIKSASGTSELWEDWMFDHGVHYVIGTKSVPWRGSEIAINHVDQFGGDAAFRLAVGQHQRGTSPKMNIKVQQIPLDAFLHMYTPTVTREGAVQSQSMGLWQSNDKVLQYLRDSVGKDSAARASLMFAMRNAVRGINPKSPMDVMHANIYIRGLIDATAPGERAIEYEGDSSWSMYQDHIMSSYYINPFDEPYRDQTMNLIRKRVLTDRVMKPKRSEYIRPGQEANITSGTWQVGHDLYTGTQHGLRGSRSSGAGEIIVPHTMKRMVVPRTGTGAYEKDGQYKFAPIRAEDVDAKGNFQANSYFAQVATELVGKGILPKRVPKNLHTPGIVAGMSPEQQWSLVLYEAFDGTNLWGGPGIGPNPSTMERFYSVMDWALSGASGALTDDYSGIYNYFKAIDSRPLRYGLAGVGQHIPKATADDTIPIVAARIGTKLQGNQVIYNHEDVSGTHMDYDGDQFSAFFDAPFDVLNEYQYNVLNAKMQVSDTGAAASGQQVVPGPTINRKFNLFDFGQKVRQRSQDEYAKRMVGRSITVGQAVSEMVGKDMKFRFKDEHGNWYFLKPRLRYEREGDKKPIKRVPGFGREEEAQITGQTASQRNWQRLARSGLGSAHAAYQQVFVSSEGQTLDDSLLPDKVTNRLSWQDDLISQYFVRDYTDPELSSLNQPHVKELGRKQVSSVDVQLLERVISQFRDVSGIGTPDYVDGKESGKNWNQVMSNIGSFRRNRGNTPAQNQIIASVLQSLIGNKNMGDLEAHILKALGWDVIHSTEKGVEIRRPNQSIIARGLHSELANLVSFGNHSWKSPQESLADVIWGEYTTFRNEAYGGVDHANREWLTVLNNYYHAQQATGLTSVALNEITKQLLTYHTDKNTRSLSYYNRRISGLNAEMASARGARERAGKLAELRYYQGLRSKLYDNMPKGKKLDARAKINYLLNPGKGTRKHSNIYHDSEAVDKWRTGMAWNMMRDQELATVSNSAIRADIVAYAEKFHQARRAMRRAMGQGYDSFVVPRNILRPSSTIRYTATEENATMMEYIWMRQLHEVFRGAQPWKGQRADLQVGSQKAIKEMQDLWERPDEPSYALAMALAMPRDSSIEGAYYMKGTTFPVYRRPYMRALQFYRQFAGSGVRNTTATMEAISKNKIGLMYGWTTPDALNAISSYPSGITPLPSGFYANMSVGKFAAAPGIEHMFSQSFYDDLQSGKFRMAPPGLASLAADGSQIKFIEMTHGDHIEAALGGPRNHQAAIVTMNRRMLGSMPIFRLAEVLASTDLMYLRYISARGKATGAGTKGVRVKATEAERKQAVAQFVEDLKRTGKLEIEGLDDSIRQRFEDFFLEVTRRTLPDPDWKHIKKLGKFDATGTTGADVSSMTRRVNDAFNNQIDLARIAGDEARATELSARRERVVPRLDALMSMIARNKLLKVYEGGVFPYRSWIHLVLGKDPLSHPEGMTTLTEREVMALESDYQLTVEGLQEMHKGPITTFKRLFYPTAAIMSRDRHARTMYWKVAMAHQKYMAAIESNNNARNEIEKMIKDVSGIDPRTAPSEQIGYTRGFVDRLNKVDAAIEEVSREMNERNITGARRKTLRKRLAKLSGYRADLETTKAYTMQDAVVRLMHGTDKWDGSNPVRFKRDVFGKQANLIARAYPELRPIAGKVRQIIDKTGNRLDKVVEIQTDNLIKDLERVIYEGADREPTPADRKMLDQLRTTMLNMRRITAYFPMFKPEAIKEMAEVFNPRTGGEFTDMWVHGGSDGQIREMAEKIEGFFNANLEERTEFSPEWSTNLLGSIQRYVENAAAYEYRVLSEMAIRDTVDRYYKKMQRNDFSENFERGTRSLVAYIQRYKTAVYGRRTDMPLESLFRIARAMSTVSKIGFSGITYIKQGSQKLLNLFMLGPKAMRESNVLLDAVENKALRAKVASYEPVGGFADSAINRYDEAQRNLFNENPVVLSKAEQFLGKVLQKSLGLLRAGPILGEKTMRRELFVGMFTRTYRELAKSPAIESVFRRRIFSDYMLEHYPDAKRLKNMSFSEYKKNWHKHMEDYITTQSEKVAFEAVQDIHFDYSKFAKPEALRSPIGAALWHLRSYDIFHAALVGKVLAGMRRRVGFSDQAARDMGHGWGWRAKDLLKSNERQFATRFGAAYGLIGLASMIFPLGMMAYFSPGALDLTRDITGYVTGLWGPSTPTKEKKKEQLFYGKGLMTAVTGPIVSDLVDIINLAAADQIGDPNEALKFLVGFRDYRAMPGDVKFRKWANKVSAEGARLIRDIGYGVEALGSGRLMQELPGIAAGHLGINTYLVQPHEQAVSKAIGGGLQELLGMHAPPKPPPQMAKRPRRPIPPWLGG